MGVGVGVVGVGVGVVGERAGVVGEGVGVTGEVVGPVPGHVRLTGGVPIRVDLVVPVIVQRHIDGRVPLRRRLAGRPRDSVGVRPLPVLVLDHGVAGHVGVGVRAPVGVPFLVVVPVGRPEGAGLLGAGPVVPR